TSIEEFKEWNYEGKIYVGNGETKWFEGKSLPTKIGDDIVFNGIIIDITERKSVEKELKESEQILQNIFNFSPVPLMISRVSDGKIIMANEGVEKLMGIPVNKILGNKTLNQYVDIEDRIKIMTAITKNGVIKNIEVPFKRYDGQLISCLISTEIVILKGKKMFLTAITDISERKKAEEALQKSEDNLRTVFENTQVGYILFNDNLIVKSFNQPAQEFTTKGLNKSLMEGSFFLDYMPSDNHAELQENLRLVLAGNLVEYDLKLGIENKEENWYHIKFSPVSNKETYVVGFIMSIENITDRKKNEIELNKSFDLVNQQNKRLLNFSYIVSHNLRSHTSNIISMLSLIQSADSEEEKEEMIAMLVDVSNELNETILNLNDVVSIQSNVNIVVDQLNLRSYVNKAIHVVGDQITAKKATVNNLVPNDILINYNPAYLESVLFNFISNGIKYGHPDRLPVITLDTFLDKGRLVLRIADNGIGIDMKKNGDKLFGMFKTFHGNSDARGVGLFITKNQIEAMGGKVEVESKLHQGTTFKIYF
ncbi:MAG: PAS domain-containing sensor histidine kinase, partial [Cytophagales bacterium]|nr:PAS domain-containing sensor histidine kinase [Cytophagales bacterium]